MKWLILAVALVVASLSTQGQDWGQMATMKIWDNTTAPHSNGIEGASAELYIFPADSLCATGQAVVICPGGGYSDLAIEHEGTNMAKWLAANGITAAVLKYRMPNGVREVPLEDACMALRIMGGLEAGTTGFLPSKVGIIGSSAGGHLAASASTISDYKPAFAILFYPVITGDEDKCHKGSFDNLLGNSRSEQLTKEYSLENRVTEQSPPTLILYSDDDRLVPPINGSLYYSALKQSGVEASIHIYPNGGHGWGMSNDFEYKSQWQQAVLDWLQKINK